MALKNLHGGSHQTVSFTGFRASQEQRTRPFPEVTSRYVSKNNLDHMFD